MTEESNSKSNDYVASLDGLRAIAILSVIVFHLHPPLLPGGFTGVDVFFVLSGFLITKIILKDLRDKKFSLRRFFIRRIHRLLPNALVCIILVTLLANVVTPPSSERYIGEHGLWTLLNFSNIFAWRKLGGYWGAGAEASPLTHFWSLAVEEQFYFVYPFLLIMLIAIGYRKIPWFLLLGLLISLSLCLFATHYKGMNIPAFYLLPTRGWQLLSGGLLSAILACSGENSANVTKPLFEHKIINAIGIIGVTTILAGFLFIRGHSHYPGISSLVPTLGTMMTIYAAMQSNSLISRILSERRTVWIGKLSYSLYLWHWPMIVIGIAAAKNYAQPKVIGSLIGCTIGIALAIIAYKLVEQPMRKVKSSNHKKLLGIAALFVTAFVICMTGKIGYRKIDPNGHFASPIWNADLYNAGRRDIGKFSNPNFYDVKYSDKPLPEEKLWENEGVVFRYGQGEPQVVVFGSSHAMMYSQVIHDICQNNNLSVAFLCMSHGQHPFLDTTPCHNFPTQKEASAFDQKRRELLKKWNPELLLLVDRWDFREPGEHARRMKNLLQEVTRLTKQVCIFNQIPVLDVSRDNLRATTAWSIDKGKGKPVIFADVKEGHRKIIHNFNKNQESIYRNVVCLSPEKMFYHLDGSVKYSHDKIFYYVNEDHLTNQGATYVMPMIEKMILDAVSSPVAK